MIHRSTKYRQITRLPDFASCFTWLLTNNKQIYYPVRAISTGVNFHRKLRTIYISSEPHGELGCLLGRLIEVLQRFAGNRAQPCTYPKPYLSRLHEPIPAILRGYRDRYRAVFDYFVRRDYCKHGQCRRDWWCRFHF